MEICHSSRCRTQKVLSYSIYKASSYSPKYPPNKILEDKPNDNNSRWTSNSYVSPQYLILKLIRPSVVTEITFGKYSKEHMCNIKRFKVYGGMTEESMVELLDNGLTNDANAETFKLKHSILNNEFPCRYVKIVPLQTWGLSYNFCIWFLSLKGFDDNLLVNEALHWLNEYRQREAIRLCLKHLRQKNYCEAFESLQKRTKVQLEDESLTKLHKLLVIDGNYEMCEKVLEDASNQGLFENYIRKQDYKPFWKLITPPPKSDRPGMRGGHQMCIDSYAEVIYLFGGWDGAQDLADFWSFHILTGEWYCISTDTSLDGGPSARSCHKICVDPFRKKIYTLGRFLDLTIRSVDNIKSDFYVYDIERNKWTLITDDTAAIGGPRLVFDHQMCMDLEKNTIYIFGGRIVSCLNDERSLICPEQPLFSGLYAYNATNNTWRKLREDSHIVNTNSGPHEIKSRIGHSMLFHDKLKLLYIFAGQRQKEYLSDFFTYNVETDEIVTINDGEKSEVPATGFTQRATIDPDNHEIYVLAGLNNRTTDNRLKEQEEKEKEQEESEATVKNSLWIYDIVQDRWSCIYRNENCVENANKNANNNNITNNNINNESLITMGDKSEPCPRFAHQLVYNHIKKVHYLFGGNPGKNQSPTLRLDDLWALELSRLSSKQLLRKCKRFIREQTFKEIIQRNETSAVYFLQNQLSETFDHSDPDEIKEFQSLASLIFKDDSSTLEINPDLDPEMNYINRTKVFDAIVEYFPENMTQPKGNLVDLALA